MGDPGCVLLYHGQVFWGGCTGPSFMMAVETQWRQSTPFRGGEYWLADACGHSLFCKGCGRGECGHGVCDRGGGGGGGGGGKEAPERCGPRCTGVPGRWLSSTHLATILVAPLITRLLEVASIGFHLLLARRQRELPLSLLVGAHLVLLMQPLFVDDLLLALLHIALHCDTRAAAMGGKAPGGGARVWAGVMAAQGDAHARHA